MLKEQIKQALYLFNNGADNQEYLRGQLELAMYLLDPAEDNADELLAELHKSINELGEPNG